MLKSFKLFFNKLNDVVFFLITISLLMSVKIGNCQVFGDRIEKVIQSTVLIKIGKGSGSGILVRDTSTSRIYLVTAKHVIFDEKKQFKEFISTDAIIQFYAKDFKGDSASYILIDLNEAMRNNCIYADSSNDICVVTVADFEKSGAIKYLKWISRAGHSVKYDPYLLLEDTITRVDSLYLGEHVFIVGFPTAIGFRKIPQFDYDKPLLKRGAIANMSDKFNTFVIDCPVYGGNSGGPVCQGS